jgi:hypothetical protein
MSGSTGTHKIEQDKVYKHFIERTRLGELHKIFLYGATGLLWLSGLVWVLFHYFGVHQGEFGEVRSPLEPWSLKIHGAAAMAFLLVLGSLISGHIRRGWALKRNRLSGVIVTSTCGVLILSGWILYYLATENVRNAVSLIHWIVGLLLPLLIYLHILAWRWEQKR